ncbi:MAG: response regulator [Burkholderiales bacterium]|jgi:CheY-like chemotaxis protein|nr:response regulator [Burkholderiales bacterium]
MSLPLFYFPTTIICVDDNPLMLQTLDNIIVQNYPRHLIKKFANSISTLDFFKEYTSEIAKIQFLRGFVEHEYYDLMNHNPVDLELSKFSELSKNLKKNNEVSVIIVDYEMPGLNGLELCQHLKHIPAKKVLLTAHADYKLALDAFNDKLIDRFVIKGQDDTAGNLVTYIKSLTLEYFDNMTAKLQTHLTVNGNLAIFDDNFINFFSELINTRQIIEYYLIDKNGSFLLINNIGEHFCLVVHTDQSLDYFVELYDDELSAEKYVNLVQQRRLIPFFGLGVYPEKINVNEWEQHFYEPQVLRGTQTSYFWKIIKL